MEKFPLTKEGFIALEQELKNLKGVERPNIIAAIAEDPFTRLTCLKMPNTPLPKKNKALLKGAFRP
jgi:hypothetical protein